MAQRIPPEIVVGPHTYKVVRKTVPRELGKCFYDEQFIRLKPGMKRSKSQEVLLHEVLHACGYPSLAERDEEFVDTVAPQLLQVLQQNPKLVQFLIQKGAVDV